MEDNKIISHGFCGIQIADLNENGSFGKYTEIPGAISLSLTPKIINIVFTGLDLIEYTVYEKLIGYTGSLEITFLADELKNRIYSENGECKFFSLKFKDKKSTDTDTEYEYHYCRFSHNSINLSTDTATASYNTLSIPIEIYIELPPEFTEG